MRCFNSLIFIRNLWIIKGLLHVCYTSGEISDVKKVIISNDSSLHSVVEKVCDLMSPNSENLRLEVSCDDTALTKFVVFALNNTISIDESVLCKYPFSKALHLSTIQKNEKIKYLRTHNILESVVDLMVYWKRFNGALIYDEFSGIETDYFLTLRYLRLRSIKAVMIAMNPTSNISQEILKATHLEKNIIIICQKELTNAIINEVNSFELMSGNHTWIIITPEVPEALIGVDIPPNSQVTLMSWRINKNLSFSSSRNPRWSLENRNLMNNWMQKNQPCELSNKNVELYISEMDKFPAYLKSTPDIDILDAFFSLESNSTETVKFAHWNQITKLFMLETLEDHDRERRLKGRRVRMAVFQHKPYTFFNRTNGNLHITGYLRELFDMIIETLNIKYTFRETDEQFGTNENGTFTGFAGRLYRREVDMGMNVLAMTPGRRLGVRYVGPITKAHFAIIYNRPDPIIPPTTYLLPFTLLVWIFIFVSLAFIVVAIYVVMMISPISRRHVTLSEKVHTMSFRFITLTFLEEVFEYPPGLPSKVVYGTLLMAVLAMFAHYTSIFTSFLAYQEEKIPFRSMEDVVTNEEYQVLIVNKTRHQDVFQNAKDGVYADVWQRILRQGDKSFEYSFESGMLRTLTGKYSYISDGPTCMYLSHGNCSVAFAPVKYYEEYYNMAHRRDFPYTRLFSFSLTQIMESGIFRRLTLRYYLDSRPPCNFGGNSLSFGINQVVGVFFIYACGILLSIVVLVIERQVPRHFIPSALRKECRSKIPTVKIYSIP